jgi:hypothetical protein
MPPVPDPLLVNRLPDLLGAGGAYSTFILKKAQALWLKFQAAIV